MSVGRLGRSPGIGRAGGSVGHGPPHLLEQRERAPGARRVRPVREQHDEQIAIGIDPERRPRPPGVSVAARPEQRADARSEEHTSELQSPYDLVCRLLLEKKKKKNNNKINKK